MKVICAWCDKTLEEWEWKISHWICKECAKEHFNY